MIDISGSLSKSICCVEWMYQINQSDAIQYSVTLILLVMILCSSSDLIYNYSLHLLSIYKLPDAHVHILHILSHLILITL